jgi:hypothetical protein
MARPKQSTNGAENISGYFRAIFKENPTLLKSRSNDELLKRWMSDHPKEKEVPARVKQGLANVKSVLRSKRRGKKRKADSEQGAVAVLEKPQRSPRLETLEERIDDALTMARNLDREALESVIAALRRARNEVVWKMGQ